MAKIDTFLADFATDFVTGNDVINGLHGAGVHILDYLGDGHYKLRILHLDRLPRWIQNVRPFNPVEDINLARVPKTGHIQTYDLFLRDMKRDHLVVAKNLLAAECQVEHRGDRLRVVMAGDNLPVIFSDQSIIDKIERYVPATLIR